MKELLTKRTKLRFININDLESIHLLHSLEATDQYNALGIPKNVEETKSIIEPWIAQMDKETIQVFTFAIEETSNGEFIGLFGLTIGSPKYRMAEVWYKILPKFWGKGIATEVLSRVIRFGFEELKLHRIEAGVAVENIGSIRVLEKVGMTKEGRGRKIIPLKTGWSDNFKFSILDTDTQPSFH